MEPEDQIVYQTGDALDTSKATGPVVIAHICNDRGAWGAGFVLAVSRRYPAAEQAYRSWSQRGASLKTPFRLGETQIVQVGSDPDVYIANMIGQVLGGSTPPIRYTALRDCLATVAKHAKAVNASVQMPRIGTGLAGGVWARIEPLIREQLVAQGVPVTVYDLPR